MRKRKTNVFILNRFSAINTVIYNFFSSNTVSSMEVLHCLLISYLQGYRSIKKRVENYHGFQKKNLSNPIRVKVLSWSRVWSILENNSAVWNYSMDRLENTGKRFLRFIAHESNAPTLIRTWSHMVSIVYLNDHYLTTRYFIYKSLNNNGGCPKKLFKYILSPLCSKSIRIFV